MSRPVEKQLSTQYWLLAMFNSQIAEFETTGAHASRIVGLREGKTNVEKQIIELGGEVQS